MVFLISRASVTCNDIAAPPPPPPPTHYGWSPAAQAEIRRRRETKIGTWPLKLNPNIFSVLANDKECNVFLWGPTAPFKMLCPMSDHFLMTSLFVLLSPRNTVSCAGCSQGATLLLAFKLRTVLYLYCSLACHAPRLSAMVTPLEFY